MTLLWLWLGFELWVGQCLQDVSGCLAMGIDKRKCDRNKVDYHICDKICY